MNKPTLVFQGPIFTRSGYGDHCRDLMKSLRKMDKFEIKIIPLRWGNTPQNQVDGESEFGRWMLERVITKLEFRPDVFMQVSVANEFTPSGNFNIGITAGVETTICPKEFIEGCNKMDLIITPSNFTKQNLAGTVYQQKNQQTGEIVGEFKITKPVEVLFEGLDTQIFEKGKKSDILKDVKEDFNFLIVGHWLKGNLGQDRKDTGMTIKTLATVFQYLPKEKRPGIIIKTSHAGFSVIDRETIREKIQNLLEPLGDKAPSVYLLHGDLSEEDMSSLYYDKKVKAMVSFTKGEGYGRPLAEFCATGKPIIVSGWSGHMDFLPADNAVLLEGSLTNVDESASDKFLLKEAQWFTVNYSNAANKIYDVFNNYNQYLSKSAGLRTNILNNFSIEKMNEKFEGLIEKYVQNKPKIVPFKVPNLPKLNKI